MPIEAAPIQNIRGTPDVIHALPQWPVGRLARLYGVPDQDLAAFYLPHVLLAHAIHARLQSIIASIHQLMLYGDAHRAQNLPLFAAPDCTSEVLRHLLGAQHLGRVRLVTPSPSIVPDLDPAVRRLFPTLTEEGIEVRPLRLAGCADPPDALVLLPTADPTEFELERTDHALWRHLAESVVVVGVSGTRAEAAVVAAYLELFGITVTEPELLPPMSMPGDRPDSPMGFSWQIVAHARTQPTHQRLERFGRMVDLLRNDDTFDDELFGACTADPDPSQPYLQLVHGHWMHLELGTIHYVASLDEMLTGHEPQQPQGIAAAVASEILARRPAATAPLIDRWNWILDVFEDAQAVPLPAALVFT